LSSSSPPAYRTSSMNPTQFSIPIGDVIGGPTAPRAPVTRAPPPRLSRATARLGSPRHPGPLAVLGPGDRDPPHLREGARVAGLPTSVVQEIAVPNEQHQDEPAPWIVHSI